MIYIDGQTLVTEILVWTQMITHRWTDASHRYTRVDIDDNTQITYINGQTLLTRGTCENRLHIYGRYILLYQNTTSTTSNILYYCCRIRRVLRVIYYTIAVAHVNDGKPPSNAVKILLLLRLVILLTYSCYCDQQYCILSLLPQLRHASHYELRSPFAKKIRAATTTTATTATATTSRYDPRPYCCLG